MEPSTAWGLLVTAVAALTAVAGLASWSRPGSRTEGAGLLVTLAVAALLATGASTGEGSSPPALVAVTFMATAAAAVCGGGPLTTTVFALVDRAPSGVPPRSDGVGSAGDVLRGGSWIGSLERIAVFASLACGWPEGIALTLALKGLGRYPELRNEEHSGIAERFLIGTFTSVLWACAWAGVALAATR